MIDFIIKLENMLKQSGYDVVFMRKFTGKENERSDIK